VDSEGRESTSSLLSVREEAWRSKMESSEAAIMADFKRSLLGLDAR
jgi:hypothetical protein